MGWDAYAIRPDIDASTAKRDEFLTPVAREAFLQASKNVSGVPSDGNDVIGSGELDGRCIGILARAAGIPDCDETSPDGSLLWSSDAVQRAWAQARWDISLEGLQEPFDLDRARTFLEICAAHRLAILFTY
jgi:hypothetical protein